MSDAHCTTVVSADTVRGFPPIADARATRRLLGSMPGQASLDAQQDYAHPRNSFWRIVEATLGAAADLPYDARCAALRRCGINAAGRAQGASQQVW